VVALKKRSDDYNEHIRFETLRVAVLEFIEGLKSHTHPLPETLKKKVWELFAEEFLTYEKIISSNLTSKKYDYGKLKSRLLREKTEVSI